CVGARPVAVVNCLNFGNPEHPEVMWQLSEAIDGMAAACRGLSLPVVGGNVSLYNESRGRDIDPTPVVGTLGLVDHLDRRPPGVAMVAGSAVAVAGAVERHPSLGGSRWAAEMRSHRGGLLPDLDLDLHGRLLALVADLVGGSVPLVDGVHDVSDGGLGLALAEMAVASQTGFRVSLDGLEWGSPAAAVFGEGPSRVALSVPPGNLGEVRARAGAAGVGVVVIGEAGGERMVVDGSLDIGVAEATDRWRGALPEALGMKAS
ncbi:MAG: AIR synthase-related protein, partial [Acidimicrobiales bacterium]